MSNAELIAHVRALYDKAAAGELRYGDPGAPLVELIQQIPALIAAAERPIVRTVAEGYALPLGSIIRGLGPHGVVYERDDEFPDLWHQPGTEMSGDLFDTDLPAEVLYQPEGT